MSFREEDNQKNCPSRGLGLAAAAIGVGVGAALYYFFGKRSEHPTASGSTTEEWHCEPDLTFLEESGSSENSYTTLSEHTTTDSSIIEDNENFCNCSNVASDYESDSDISESDSDTDSENYTSVDSDSTSSSSSINFNNDSQDIFSSLNNVLETLSNDITNNMEWDVTSTLDIPSYTSNPNNRINNIFNIFSPRRNSRKRSKTLEQCSICFDIILQDQESMILPCTHYFHTSCILPWLQEQQTCPNCRIAVD